MDCHPNAQSNPSVEAGPNGSPAVETPAGIAGLGVSAGDTKALYGFPDGAGNVESKASSSGYVRSFRLRFLDFRIFAWISGFLDFFPRPKVI